MTLRRVALEVTLLAFALTLAVTFALWPGTSAGERLARGAFDLAVMYVGLLAGLLGALRLRHSQGFAAELLGMVVVLLAAWLGSASGQLVGAWAGREPFEAWVTSLALGGIAAVACSIGYLVVRAVALAWPVWNRMRRAHLLWSITHAQLVASVLAAVAVAVAITIAGLSSSNDAATVVLQLERDGGVQRWFILRVLPAATALLVFGLVAAVAVMPVSALISYSALRRPTQRLSALAGAAEALRGGDFATRVAVAGEDEVARLQTSFNAMAGELERTLRELHAERDRVSGLLDARRELVASVSHELRTPVATVRGHLEAAEAHGGLRSDDLATVQHEVARLERLIDDLFLLSRAEVGRLDLRLAPTDVGALVRRVSAAMAPAAWTQRRVELLSSAEPDLPLAVADAQRLEQVVSNLLSNAIRHTPPGGLVIARVTDGPTIEIRDTGAGIASDQLPHIFDRFYRGEGSDGAGLGLALVRELTEAMGATVDVHSTPSEGTCFKVHLQVAPRDGKPSISDRLTGK